LANITSFEVLNKLKTSSTIITTWLKSNGMIVNESKTEFVLFHKTRKERCKFDLNDITIKSKKSVKALGIIIDQNLNFEAPVDNISKQCALDY